MRREYRVQVSVRSGAFCSCTISCGSRRASASASVTFCSSASEKRSSMRSLCSRSEEHTSELQSLMRISYAVFCLKKKQHTYNTNTVRVIVKNQPETKSEHNT